MDHGTTKTCCRCKTSKPLGEFHRDRSAHDGLDARCKSCRVIAHQRNPGDPERRFARHLMKAYGLTPADYDAMLGAQGGVCAICKRPESMSRLGTMRRLCVDHDHDTGKVRGLLCASCNFAVGRFEDDPELMQNAALYMLSSLEQERQ